MTKCSKLAERFRYTPESVFDTFPWPQAPDAKAVRAVAAAGRAVRRIRAETLPTLTPIRYGAFAVTASTQAALATDFLAHLRGEAARALWQRDGLALP